MLELVTWPDKRLKTACKLVPDSEFGEEKLRKQVGDMIYTMLANNGIGLAANQVGFDNRVIIVAKSPDGAIAGLPLVMINPKVTSKSSGKQTMREGCLSFPGQTSIRRRAKRVTLKAQNVDGGTFTWQATGLQAQCIQHEICHLNGKTMFDK